MKSCRSSSFRPSRWSSHGGGSPGPVVVEDLLPLHRPRRGPLREGPGKDVQLLQFRLHVPMTGARGRAAQHFAQAADHPRGESWKLCVLRNSAHRAPDCRTPGPGSGPGSRPRGEDRSRPSTSRPAGALRVEARLVALLRGGAHTPIPVRDERPEQAVRAQRVAEAGEGNLLREREIGQARPARIGVDQAKRLRAGPGLRGGARSFRRDSSGLPFRFLPEQPAHGPARVEHIGALEAVLEAACGDLPAQLDEADGPVHALLQRGAAVDAVREDVQDVPAIPPQRASRIRRYSGFPRRRRCPPMRS